MALKLYNLSIKKARDKETLGELSRDSAPGTWPPGPPKNCACVSFGRFSCGEEKKHLNQLPRKSPGAMEDKNEKTPPPQHPSSLHLSPDPEVTISLGEGGKRGKSIGP